ncbi:hypothetical protein glysoja_017889, partial [Glycine soja]
LIKNGHVAAGLLCIQLFVNSSSQEEAIRPLEHAKNFRRRCKIAEVLVEKNFDLAFLLIYEFNLPAVDIYASVAASLAERKRGSQLTEFFRNIKGTIDDDDWDQALHTNALPVPDMC